MHLQLHNIPSLLYTQVSKWDITLIHIPHLRYFPISTLFLCPLIRSSFSARGNFPQESSQWKICTMANKNIEDNEEIVKRNLVTIALCALVLITSAHHHHHRHQRDKSNNPLLTFRYLVYILCQVVIINIYHARKVKRFLDGLCNTSYLTQEGCKLSKSLWGMKNLCVFMKPSFSLP